MQPHPLEKIFLAKLKRNLGKIKILHAQKHPISYGYDSCEEGFAVQPYLIS